MNMSTLLGYLAGGVLLATVGPRWACLLNAGTFLLSAALLIKLPPLRPTPEAGGPPATAVRHLVDAGRLMIADRVVLLAVFMAVIPAAIATALEAEVLTWASLSLPGLGWLPGAVLAGAGAVSLAAIALVEPPELPATSLRLATGVAIGVSVLMAALFMLGDGATSATALILSGLLYLPLVLANVIISPRLQPTRRAASFGLLMGALTIAQTIAALLLGVLIRTLGTQAAFSVTVVAAAVVSSLLLIPLSRYQSVPTPARKS
jgi:hypothetical protein